MSDPMLRAASEADVPAIADLWHRGWVEAHTGHVPAALLAHRTLDHHRRRVPVRLATTTLADVGGRLLGFVVTHDDEVEQLYVDAAARGTRVATTLLRHAERVVAANHPRAWLAVVAGNARARRFYERSGWSDAGLFDYPAFTDDDTPVLVPSHRYVRDLP